MKLRSVVIAVVALLVGACTAPPEGVQPINGFDAQRYMGKWYEIARLDHSFERGLSNVTAEYALNSDGTVKVLNKGFDSAGCEWSTAEGRAEFLGSPDIASLKVTFFWPFAGGYHVIALDREEYEYALIAGPSFDYLWILARTPNLAPSVRDVLVAQAAAVGFDVDELIFVSHEAEKCPGD